MQCRLASDRVCFKSNALRCWLHRFPVSEVSVQKCKMPTECYQRETQHFYFQVQNLYDVSVFENNLFLTSWRNQCIIRLAKYDSDDHSTIANINRPFAIHVVHRQRQPDITHPCQNANGGCEHLCITVFKNKQGEKNSSSSFNQNALEPHAQCLCQPGFALVNDTKCQGNTRTIFIYNQ